MGTYHVTCAQVIIFMLVSTSIGCSSACPTGCICRGRPEERDTAVCYKPWPYTNKPVHFDEHITSIEFRQLLFQDVEPYLSAAKDIYNIIIYPPKKSPNDNPLPDDMFKNTENLKTLTIHQTINRRAPMGLAKAIKPLRNLKTIDLVGNTIYCDCTLPAKIASENILLLSQSRMSAVTGCIHHGFPNDRYSIKDFLEKCADRDGYKLSAPTHGVGPQVSSVFSTRKFGNVKDKKLFNAGVKYSRINTNAMKPGSAKMVPGSFSGALGKPPSMNLQKSAPGSKKVLLPGGMSGFARKKPSISASQLAQQYNKAKQSGGKWGRRRLLSFDEAEDDRDPTPTEKTMVKDNGNRRKRQISTGNGVGSILPDYFMENKKRGKRSVDELSDSGEEDDQKVLHRNKRYSISYLYHVLTKIRRKKGAERFQKENPRGYKFLQRFEGSNMSKTRRRGKRSDNGLDDDIHLDNELGGLEHMNTVQADEGVQPIDDQEVLRRSKRYSISYLYHVLTKIRRKKGAERFQKENPRGHKFLERFEGSNMSKTRRRGKRSDNGLDENIFRDDEPSGKEHVAADQADEEVQPIGEEEVLHRNKRYSISYLYHVLTKIRRKKGAERFQKENPRGYKFLQRFEGSNMSKTRRRGKRSDNGLDDNIHLDDIPSGMEHVAADQADEEVQPIGEEEVLHRNKRYSISYLYHVLTKIRRKKGVERFQKENPRGHKFLERFGGSNMPKTRRRGKRSDNGLDDNIFPDDEPSGMEHIAADEGVEPTDVEEVLHRNKRYSISYLYHVLTKIRRKKGAERFQKENPRGYKFLQRFEGSNMSKTRRRGKRSDNGLDDNIHLDDETSGMEHVTAADEGVEPTDVEEVLHRNKRYSISYLYHVLTKIRRKKGAERFQKENPRGYKFLQRFEGSNMSKTRRRGKRSDNGQNGNILLEDELSRGSNSTEHRTEHRTEHQATAEAARRLAMYQLPMNDLTVKLNPFDPFEVDLFFRYILHKENLPEYQESTKP